MTEQSEKIQDNADEQKEITRQLIEFREQLGISQAKVAEDLYLSLEEITDFEENKIWNQKHAAYLAIYYQSVLSMVMSWLVAKMIQESER